MNTDKISHIENCIHNLFVEANWKLNEIKFLSDVNIGKENIKGNRRALVSYLIKPLLIKGERLSFSNAGIARNIVKALNELGFIVDVFDWKNEDFIPGRNYDLFIGHENTDYKIKKMYENLDPECIKIYFTTGSYWKFHNKQELLRLRGLNKRKEVNLIPDRYASKYKDFGLFNSDGVIVLGSDRTYKKLSDAFILNNAAYSDSSYDISKKDFEKAKDNFLFFSGTGNIHKGLDLLLEVFSQLKNKHLYICTKLDDGFARVYEKELFNTNNIHFIGFVNPYSKKFYKVMNLCNYVIHPSCSEGSPGGVIECMHHGLIPIISRESNIDVKGFGYIIRDCSIEGITREIKRVAKERFFEKKAKKIINIAREKFSEEAFLNNLKKHINHILYVSKKNEQK